MKNSNLKKIKYILILLFWLIAVVICMFFSTWKNLLFIMPISLFSGSMIGKYINKLLYIDKQ